MGKLTDFRKRVVEAYFKMDRPDAGVAYREAGGKGKSPNKLGSEILNYPECKAYMEQLQKERATYAKIDANYVLNKFTEMAELDPADLFNDDMTIKPISQWPKAWRTSISAIDVVRLANANKDNVQQIIKSIKWPDKVKVMELIGKHIGVGAFSEVNYNVEMSHEEWLKTLK